MISAVNSCRFVGKLKSRTIYKAEDLSWVLLRGILNLPSLENENIGQNINIISWNSVAERLLEVSEQQWICIICSYSPSMFRDKLQDTFLVDSFSIVKNDER